VEPSVIISILSLAVAAIVGFTNLKRNQATDNRQTAAEMTTVIVKLEALNNNITEMKSDVRNTRADLQEIRDRLIICEQSTKSAHHRIDALENNNNP
jgi:peptidoglycan hydrolase CwlO-like protein